MSMFSGLFMLLVMLAVGPNGPQDMLDLLSTEAYWQSKQVVPTVEQLEKDAGPAQGGEGAAAADAEKEVQTHAKARDVQRLMAIRTLGEMKAAAAMPTLKLLLDSKDNFVAEYAARAIARIEGKPVPPVAKKPLVDDLKLLPRNVSIVGQVGATAGVPLTMDVIASLVGEKMKESGGEEVLDNKQVVALLTTKWLNVVEAVGNIRIDGLTFAVAEDVGRDSGWVMLIVRGKGDRSAILAMMTMLAGQDKVARDGEIDVIQSSGQVLIFPSDEMLVMMFGPSEEKTTEAKDALLAAIRNGKGEFEANEQIGELMKKVDVKGPIWAVGKLNAFMQERTFGGVETFTLTSKQEKESVSFALAAQGADAETLKATTDKLNESIQESLASLKPKAEKTKAMEMVVDLLESLKVTSDGNAAAMTGEVKLKVVYTMVSEGPLMWMISSEMRRQKAQNQNGQ